MAHLQVFIYLTYVNNVKTDVNLLSYIIIVEGVKLSFGFLVWITMSLINKMFL